MSKYRLEYSRAALKFTKKNRLMAMKFRKIFDSLCDNLSVFQKGQTQYQYDIKKFHDPEYDDVYRLRIGDYRAIFRIIDDRLVILVIDIASRGSIYK